MFYFWTKVKSTTLKSVSFSTGTRFESSCSYAWLFFSSRDFHCFLFAFILGPPPLTPGTPPPAYSEMPPPYAPPMSMNTEPSVICRVCQQLIYIRGREHQRVVKCGNCQEATVSGARIIKLRGHLTYRLVKLITYLIITYHLMVIYSLNSGRNCTQAPLTIRILQDYTRSFTLNFQVIFHKTLNALF